MGNTLQKSIKIDLVCSCRLPNDPTLPMLFCDDCRHWFHTDCEVKSATVPKHGKWVCKKCKKFIKFLS